MELTESDFKRNFRNELHPFFEMLEDKNKLSFPEWQNRVRQTATNIIQNPDQYLSADRPSKEITEKLLAEVFEDFIRTESMAIPE